MWRNGGVSRGVPLTFRPLYAAGMLTIDTLGALIDTGHELSTSCEACRTPGPDADLANLVMRLGRDFVFVHPTVRVLSPYLLCPRCHGPMEYRLLAPAGGTGGAHGQQK